MTEAALTPDGAPIVDDVLADIMATQPDPIEKIVPACPIALGHNVRAGRLANPTRIVRLACGHFALTRLKRACACRRCGAMIRAGYDYDAFRRLHARDEFDWPKDRLREYNQLRQGNGRWSRPDTASKDSQP